MLLGAARYLCETRNFDGTVIVVFQPAEENGGGGEVMVREGLMDRFGIEEIYGMHNVPGLPLGDFAIRPGAFYGAADQFFIKVLGKGGHAAQPHQTVDATLIAARVVTALQSIASRETDPVKQVVVSVTSFETSTKATNIIADRVHLKGTVRALDEGVRDHAERRVAEIAEGTALTFGARAEVDYQRGYPVMTNAEAETGFAAAAAREVSGTCGAAPVYLWGEDFGYMLNARPGAYIHLGIGEAAPLHHPKYDFNDEAIPFGSSWFAEIVERRMPLG